MAVTPKQASSSGQIRACIAIWALQVPGRIPGASNVGCPIQLWQVSRLQTSGPGPQTPKGILQPHDLGEGVMDGVCAPLDVILGVLHHLLHQLRKFVSSLRGADCSALHPPCFMGLVVDWLDPSLLHWDGQTPGFLTSCRPRVSPSSCPWLLDLLLLLLRWRLLLRFLLLLRALTLSSSLCLSSSLTLEHPRSLLFHSVVWAHPPLRAS